MHLLHDFPSFIYEVTNHIAFIDIVDDVLSILCPFSRYADLVNAISCEW